MTKQKGWFSMSLFDVIFQPRTVYVNAKPATIAVTLEAGGTWHEFPLNLSNEHERRRVYSILFEDGTVWDEKNGWRIDRWCVKETWIIRHNGKRLWWRSSNSGFKTGWLT